MVNRDIIRQGLTSEGGCGYIVGTQNNIEVVMVKKLTTEEFAERAKYTHGDRYEYDSVEYSGLNKRVKIFCNRHQEYFEQLAGNHLNGANCPLCAEEVRNSKRKKRPERKVVTCDDGIQRYTLSREDAILKGENKYFTGEPCSKGHVSERYVSGKSCVTCSSENSKNNYKKNLASIKEYRRQYYLDNKDAFKKRSLKFYNKVKDCEEYKKKTREYESERYWSDREFHLKRNKEWRDGNKEHLSLYRNERAKQPEHKAQSAYRNSLIRVMGKVRKEKLCSSKTILGYSANELKEHLESLWLHGMSWSNYGEWHVDHIKPIAAFIAEGVSDVSEINSLNNLAPMWAEHNRAKSDMSLKDFLEYRPDLIPLYGHLL